MHFGLPVVSPFSPRFGNKALDLHLAELRKKRKAEERAQQERLRKERRLQAEVEAARLARQNELTLFQRLIPDLAEDRTVAMGVEEELQALVGGTYPFQGLQNRRSWHTERSIQASSAKLVVAHPQQVARFEIFTDTHRPPAPVCLVVEIAQGRPAKLKVVTQQPPPFQEDDRDRLKETYRVLSEGLKQHASTLAGLLPASNPFDPPSSSVLPNLKAYTYPLWTYTLTPEGILAVSKMMQDALLTSRAQDFTTVANALAKPRIQDISASGSRSLLIDLACNPETQEVLLRVHNPNEGEERARSVTDLVLSIQYDQTGNPSVLTLRRRPEDNGYPDMNDLTTACWILRNYTNDVANLLPRSYELPPI